MQAFGDELMITFNHQSGLMRYSLDDGGLSEYMSLDSLNDIAKGVEYFNGVWHVSVETDGVYKKHASDGHSGWFMASSLTNLGVAHEIFWKEIRINVISVANTVIAADLLIDDDITPDVNKISGSEWHSQGFKPTTAGSLGKIELYIRRVGAPWGTFTVYIMADDAGTPGEPITPFAALATQTVDSSLVSTSAGFHTVIFDTPATVLDDGTRYHIAIANPGGSVSRYINWYKILFKDYDDGEFHDTIDAGGSWRSQVTKDKAFRTYVGSGDLQVSLTNDLTNYGPLASIDNAGVNIFPLKLKTRQLGYKIQAGATASATIKDISLVGIPLIASTNVWDMELRLDNEVTDMNDEDIVQDGYSLRTQLKTSYDNAELVDFKSMYYDQDKTTHSTLIESLEFDKVKVLGDGEEEYSQIARIKLRKVG